MNRRERTALLGHLAQHRAALACQCVAALGGLLGGLKYGLAGLIAGGLGVALFHLAKPGPSAELDKLTERGRPDDPD